MDKQKTQRIIGIFVIIAFVIILVPLFFGKTEVSTQVTSVKVPPLPAQQPEATTTLAKADTTDGQTPEDSAILGTPENNKVDNTNDSQPAANQVNDEQNNVQNSDQTMAVNAVNNAVNAGDAQQSNNSNTTPANTKNSQTDAAQVKSITNKQMNDESGVNILSETADGVNAKVAPTSNEINEQQPASMSAEGNTNTNANADPNGHQLASPSSTANKQNNDSSGVNILPETTDGVNTKATSTSTSSESNANEHQMALSSSKTNADQQSPASSIEETKSAVSPVRDIFSESTPVQNKVKKHRIITTERKSSATKVKPVNLSNEQIAKLTSTAWAVQMGNFKNKDNARRLADKLRTAGYKAFMKEIKSAKGNITTRVYIGPEFKHASAVTLSNKVQQDIKMEGIVVTIKPLEL